jgi:hypothetical protein
MMSPAELKELGGVPSGSWGSNYTKICRLLKTVEDMEAAPSYFDKRQRDARRALYDALTRFHPNEPAADVGKKGREIRAVRQLRTEMDTENQLDQARVSELLDKMTTDPMALIRNTGIGLIRLFTKGYQGLSMTFQNAGNANATFSGSTITITKSNFWTSENLAKGVLVHEYHHYLSGRNGELYADEFVAHWKQYLAMKLTNQTAVTLNTWLLDAPDGYKMREKRAQKGIWKGIEFAGPEQAGNLWTKYKDNIVATAAVAAG